MTLFQIIATCCCFVIAAIIVFYEERQIKEKEKRKLVKFLNNLKNPPTSFPVGYLAAHKPKIDCIEWLIGFYEGRTASSPKEYLEAMITDEQLYDYPSPAHKLERIRFLYNWVYYKQITGF